MNDNRIIFECQHMINHLESLGISNNIIHGDFISWDTVSNGLSLRLFLEGLLSMQKNYQNQENFNKNLKTIINLEVFISDFHAERVKLSFEWILSLKPSLNPFIRLKIHSVSSQGIQWKSITEFQERIEHEKQGIEQIKQNQAIIHSMKEFYGFLMFGHKGIRSYLMNNYQKSKGVGW